MSTTFDWKAIGMSSFSLRVPSSLCVRRSGKASKLRRSEIVALAQGFAFRDVRRERRERYLIVNATGKNDDAFSKGDYIEAVIEHGPAFIPLQPLYLLFCFQ